MSRWVEKQTLVLPKLVNLQRIINVDYVGGDQRSQQKVRHRTQCWEDTLTIPARETRLVDTVLLRDTGPCPQLPRATPHRPSWLPVVSLHLFWPLLCSYLPHLNAGPWSTNKPTRAVQVVLVQGIQVRILLVKVSAGEMEVPAIDRTGMAWS